jgi:hypothetical protein
MDKSPDAIIIATGITHHVSLILSQNVLKIKKLPPVLAFILKQVASDPVLARLFHPMFATLTYPMDANFSRQTFGRFFRITWRHRLPGYPSAILPRSDRVHLD